jgi:hypothetical protein
MAALQTTLRVACSAVNFSGELICTRELAGKPPSQILVFRPISIWAIGYASTVPLGASPRTPAGRSESACCGLACKVYG